MLRKARPSFGGKNFEGEKNNNLQVTILDVEAKHNQQRNGEIN